MTSSTEHIRLGLSIAALFCVFGCASADPSAPEEACDERAAANAEDALALYLEAWDEEDPAHRACLIQHSVASDAVLVATGAPNDGSRAAVQQDLDERIEALLDRTGHRDAVRAVEFRHHEARLAWVSEDASGAELERGEDWIEFDEDGFLSRIHILAGTGVNAPPTAPFLAWQQAWNTRDDTSRARALNEAVTEDVRFSDAVTDTRGRDALDIEIARQQERLGGELRLDDRVEVFASVEGEPTLVRVSAELAFPTGGTVRVVDYVRLRDGHIERLSGFPRRPH
ncbi:MAG: nuclear transport factor 2 family protein [Nannocystales bacterium]